MPSTSRARFSSDLARELFAESDLVIGAGAGLGRFTTEGGYLYPNQVVRIDGNPHGLWQRLRTADLHIRADARFTAETITRRLQQRGIRRPGWRSNTVAARIAADVPDKKEFSVTPGTLDARLVLRELNLAIPRDWDIIVAGDHCFSFAMTHLKGRPAITT